MIRSNDKYSWVEEKRLDNIRDRGLDIVLLADLVFADPNVKIRLDDRKDYGETRYLAFAMVDNERFRMCFTPRGEKIHLITIFNQHDDKQSRQNYDNI